MLLASIRPGLKKYHHSFVNALTDVVVTRQVDAQNFGQIPSGIKTPADHPSSLAMPVDTHKNGRSREKQIKVYVTMDVRTGSQTLDAQMRIYDAFDASASLESLLGTSSFSVNPASCRQVL